MDFNTFYLLLNVIVPVGFLLFIFYSYNKYQKQESINPSWAPDLAHQKQAWKTFAQAQNLDCISPERPPKNGPRHSLLKFLMAYGKGEVIPYHDADGFDILATLYDGCSLVMSYGIAQEDEGPDYPFTYCMGHLGDAVPYFNLSRAGWLKVPRLNARYLTGHPGFDKRFEILRPANQSREGLARYWTPQRIEWFLQFTQQLDKQIAFSLNNKCFTLEYRRHFWKPTDLETCLNQLQTIVKALKAPENDPEQD